MEGELSCNHITAPVEIQETEKTRLYAKLLNGLTFSVHLGGFPTDHGGGIINGSTGRATLRSNSNDDKVLCYDHSHHFKNVPLHLKKTNEGVRTVAERCNNEKRSAAAEIEEVPAKNKAT